MRLTEDFGYFKKLLKADCLIEDAALCDFCLYAPVTSDTLIVHFTYLLINSLIYLLDLLSG